MEFRARQNSFHAGGGGGGLWKRSYAAGGHFIIPGRRCCRHREKRGLLLLHNFCAQIYGYLPATHNSDPIEQGLCVQTKK
jgi:hypothetical protein